MQKINLIAQSHREKFDEDDEDDDDDTHQGWIIVRDGMYPVADKKRAMQDRDSGFQLYSFIGFYAIFTLSFHTTRYKQWDIARLHNMSDKN